MILKLIEILPVVRKYNDNKEAAQKVQKICCSERNRSKSSFYMYFTIFTLFGKQLRTIFEIILVRMSTCFFFPF